MSRQTSYEVSYNKLRFLLDTIESTEAELEQLTYDEEWYVSEVVDQLQSSKEILHDLLGIKEVEDDYDEE